MAPKPNPSDAKIAIDSASSLHSHFLDLTPSLHLPETEHTWQKIESALLHIQAITRGGAAKFPSDLISLLRENAGPLQNSLLSERTKLSGTAGDLLNSIAPRLGEKFEPLIPVFVPTLLLICARTNKVAVKRAERSLHFIIKHCKSASIVGYLRQAMGDKGQGLRVVASAALVAVLENGERERLGRKASEVEGCIRSGATDRDPEVRQNTKRLFELYVQLWPERVEGFTKPMTPTIRRYLSLPKTGALVVDVPSPLPARAGPSRTEAPRHEELPTAPSRTAGRGGGGGGGYSFFPDLPKAPSAANSGWSGGVNDSNYLIAKKRGLFAEQIAAARQARLNPAPSFQLETAAPSSSNGAHFHVSRRGDINASTPSFNPTGSGKAALFAAYKQAFIPELPQQQREKRSEHRSERSSKDKKREKLPSVRFGPEPEPKPPTPEDEGVGTVHRSKSAPVLPPPKQEEEEEEEEERQSTPVKQRPLATQTPRTGVKASRVPAQRVAVPPPSAVKVPAMRVAVATPSAKLSRVIMVEEEELSPVPAVSETTKTEVGAEDGARAACETVSAEAEGDKTETVEKKEACKEEKAKEEEKKESLAVKHDEEKKEEGERKVAPTKSAPVPAAKPAVKVAAKTAVAAKGGPSATIAARARLAASAAGKSTKPASTTSKVVAKSAPTTVATSASKVVPKLNLFAPKKPVVSSAPKTTAKPAAPTVASITTSKPPTAASSTSAVPRSKAAAPTVAAAKKATDVEAASTAANAAPKPTAPATTTTLTSRLTASTAATRNRALAPTNAKKFVPTKASSLKPKSSLSSSVLGAKSKLVGAKEAGVRKAAVGVVGKVKRASAVALPGVKVREKVEEEEVKEEERVEEVEEVREPEEGVAPVQAEDKVEVIEVQSDPTQHSTVMEPVEAVVEISISPRRTAREEKEANSSPSEAAQTLPAPQSAASPVNAPAATPLSSPMTTIVRTPLSSKDPNLPRSAPVTSLSAKLGSHVKAQPRPTPMSSPLRPSATFGGESDSESESEEEEEEEGVVQLQFRPRKMQLVLGVDSEADDASMLVETVGAEDETVLLE